MAFATKDNLHVGDTLYAVVGPSWSGDIDTREVTVTRVNGTSFYYTFKDRESDYAWKASMATGYHVDMGGSSVQFYRSKECAEGIISSYIRRVELREIVAYKVRSASLSDLEKINEILGGDSDGD